PDPADRAPRGRQPARHVDHRSPADGVRRDHSPGALYLPFRANDARARHHRKPAVDGAAPDVPAQVREARSRSSCGPVLRHRAARAAPRSGRVRTMRLALRVALAAVAATVWVGAAAGASSMHIVAGGAVTYPDRAYILTLPRPKLLQRSQVSVTENGGPVSNLPLV